MLEVQLTEAKARLSSLFDKVERGETIILKRRGKIVGKIVPEVDRQREEARQAVDNIKKLRKRIGNRNRKITIEEIISSIHEGHKY